MTTRTRSASLVSICLTIALLFGPLPGANADDKAKKDTPAKKSASPAAAPQPMNAEYSAEILKNTTEKFFLTELVDHLPSSPTVPSPEKVLGYAIGTPNKLTYTKDIYRYYRELAKTSPRVKVWTVGKSEEGREFLLVAVASDENIAKLDRYKEITAKLADPRKITDAEAQSLIGEGKAFYWASGSIHSPETGSPEMLMELAYRMAVEESPFVQNIRKNVIFLITPVIEVDGRDRMVDTYNYRKANPDKPAPGLIYWGKYVAHDNNRDGMGQALALSKVMMKNFLDWHPQILHDLHESVPFLYTSTGTGPYNAWLDPLVISEWQSLAYHEIEQMTARGVPGVWTHGFYDGWAPNYMFYVANGHNGIGRFYETFGGSGADTRERTVPAASTSRTWFRPNPPLPRVNWSIRNNINMQQSALLFAMSYVSDHHKDFLSNFYLKSKRSVAKATTEGPAAWVIVNDGRRPGLAAGLAALFQRQGAEVHTLDAETEVKVPAVADRTNTRPRGAQGDVGAGLQTGPPPASGESQRGEQRAESRMPESANAKIPAGSYVLRMDQPYSRMVDMLLDTQYYSTEDPRPYDDTGWTLGPLRNVRTMRVTDATILKAPMKLIAGEAKAAGGMSGSASTKFYVLNANAEPTLATLRFKLKDLKILAAEEAFEADGKKFAAGSFLIPTEGNPSDTRSRVESAATAFGLRAHATDADVKAPVHTVAVPRIAIVHNWVNTQNEGWFRLGLDEFSIPYSYISDQTIRNTPNLKEKYDVLVYPPVTNNISTLINGVRKRTLADGSDFGGPIPWKNTELTPNLGGPNGSIDQSEDIRGGLGFEGLINLRQFIEDGGVFVPITATASLPVELGMTEGVSITDTRTLQARGAIFNTNVEDKGSPISYGYDDTLAVYFNQAPVFRFTLAGGGGGFGGGGGGGAPGAGGAGGGRSTSGRGTASEPDIPQGRPWTEPQRDLAAAGRSRAQQETFIDPEVRAVAGANILPQRMWPRVVLRYAAEPNLFVSGMLAGANELANTPAIIDCPLGRGHIVLFGNNPMWRSETQGSFMLLLNTALHFDNLHVGRRPAPDRPARSADDDEEDIYDIINH